MNVFKVDSWWLKPFLTQTSHWLKPKLICLDFFVLFWFPERCQSSSGFFGLTTVAFDLNLFQSLSKVWVIGSGLNSSYFAYISAHSNALSYTKEIINETSPSDEAQLDLTIIVHVCLTLFSSQDLNVNPLTPKIWLLILPSSCYIFP